jgi:hypothetical protein
MGAQGELAEVVERWNVGWCIAGDYNVVRFPREDELH